MPTNVFFLNLFIGVLLYYLYSITVWSAAPQTTLWGGPGPRFEPGLGGPEAGTLPLDHHTSVFCLFWPGISKQLQWFNVFVFLNHRDLKIDIWKYSTFILLYRTLIKKTIWNKMFLYSWLGPKMEKVVFILFSFRFKIYQRRHFALAQALKMFYNFFFSWV